MQVAVLECSSQITDGVGYIVLVIVGWYCKVMQEKGNSVGSLFSRVAGCLQNVPETKDIGQLRQVVGLVGQVE